MNVAFPLLSFTEYMLFEKLPETSTSSVASLGREMFTISLSSTVIFETLAVML